jgi:hypothetical protein
MTVSQVRAIFTALLDRQRAAPARIAEEISRVLRRNEEARICHWHSRTKDFPPRRLASGFR